MSKRVEFPCFSSARPDRREVIYDPGGASMTRQEFSEECDINVLMARYEKVGVWPPAANGAEPEYFDCEAVPIDFREVMDFMNDAEAKFMTLPAKARREFDNDPRLFVEFAVDPKNLERMREWGLAAPEKVVEPPMRVEVVNPPVGDKPV